MTSTITAQDFPEIRWKAHWIWVPEDKVEMKMSLPGMDGDTRKESHGLFRKVVSLNTLPTRVPARITADSRYALYINGKEAFRGPIRSQPRRMHYDLFDLAPYLKTGENIIAVYVKFYARVLSMYIPPVANSGLGRTEMVAFEANLGAEDWLVTNESWKAVKADAWIADAVQGDEVIGGGCRLRSWMPASFPRDGNPPGLMTAVGAGPRSCARSTSVDLSARNPRPILTDRSTGAGPNSSWAGTIRLANAGDGAPMFMVGPARPREIWSSTRWA